jgi:hypothetical protein
LRDVVVMMFIEIDASKEPYSGFETTEHQISYLLNEACSKIEALKCQVFYKMKDSYGKEINLQ